MAELIDDLEKAGILVHTYIDMKRYLPARDLGKLTVGDVLKVLRNTGDNAISFGDSPHIGPKIRKAQDQFDHALRQLRKVTLKQLVS